MMDKITVRVCTGTTCFLMGGSWLESLEDNLPPHLRDRVEVVGVPCLGYCKDREYGKAPYVVVGTEVLSAPALADVIARIGRAVAEAGD